MEVKKVLQDYHFYLSRRGQRNLPVSESGATAFTFGGELDEEVRPLTLESKITDSEGNLINQNARLRVLNKIIRPTTVFTEQTLDVTIGQVEYHNLDINGACYFPIPFSDGKIRIVYR